MICHQTRLWLPDNSSGYLHIGERIFDLWAKKNKIFRPLLALLIVTGLSLISFLLHYLLIDYSEICLEVSGWLSLGSLLGIAIPMLLYSAHLRSKTFFGRMGSTDFILALWLLVHLLSVLWPLDDFFYRWNQTSGWLLLILGATLAWFGLEVFSAKRLHRALDLAPRNEAAWFATIIPSMQKIRRSSFLSAVILATGVLAWGFWSETWIDMSQVSLALLAIGGLPLAEIWGTKLLARSTQDGVQIHSHSAFERIKDHKHFVFHSNGVLRTGQYDLSEIWIDKLEEWPASSIREILWHLSEGISHPLSQALNHVLEKPKTGLFTIEGLKHLPHLGVAASLRDAQQSRVTAHFGSPGWLRVLQCEMSDEGRRRLKSWISDERICALLSLNQVIVAGVALKDYAADHIEVSLQGLERLKMTTSIFSSGARAAPEAAKTKESQWNLFPSERRVLLKHWIEKQPQIAIIRAWWDPPNSHGLPELVFDPRADSADSTELKIKNDLRALPHLVHLSRSFHRLRRSAPFALIAIAALVTWIPHPALGVGVLMGTSLFLSFQKPAAFTEKQSSIHK